MLHECRATLKLQRFNFYSFFLMKTLAVHITPFSNGNDLNAIGIHIAPAKRIFSPFPIQRLLKVAVRMAPIKSLLAIIMNVLYKEIRDFFRCVCFWHSD